MLKLPFFDHSVTQGGHKQAAAHFWELILQFAMHFGSCQDIFQK
jgi:hypothetical protein